MKQAFEKIKTLNGALGDFCHTNLFSEALFEIFKPFLTFYNLKIIETLIGKKLSGNRRP